jgi:hypothetical protein
MSAGGEFTSFEDRTDAPIPTSSDTRIGIVGIFERGPVDLAVECRSFDEVLATFGGYTVNNLETLGPIAQAYDEGAEVLIITRTCHHTDPLDPTTATCAKATLNLATASVPAGAGSVLSTNAAPYNFEPGYTLVITTDVAGPTTATFNATAAARSAAATAPYTLVNNQTLTVSIDGGPEQTITFVTANFVDISNATAAEVAAVIASQIVGAQADVSGGAPRIRSDRRGTGSGVNVTGGSANADLAFTTGNVAGTGNVSNIDAVSAAEVKTVVEAAIASCTVTNEGGFQRFSSVTIGGASSILIGASSTADTEMGLDNATHTGNAAATPNTLRIDAKDPGAYGNDLRVVIAAATTGESSRFNLAVSRAGVLVRVHENLSMVPTDARYAPTIINDLVTGDRYITATDLNAAVSDTLARPANGTFGPLTGGSDGLVDLDDNDFIGGKSASGGLVGLRTFDRVQLAELIVPQRATAAVELAKVTYIENFQKGRCESICEAPAGITHDQMVTYFKSTTGLYRLTNKVAAYWPRVKVRNPNKAIYGSADELVIPNSGMNAGIRARLDATQGAGPAEQPAGTIPIVLPRTAMGVENESVNEYDVRSRLVDANINPISTEIGRVAIDGARNANDLSSWPTVGQARLGLFLARQLAEGLIIMRQRRINEELLDKGFTQADTFMGSMMDAGQFSSRKKSEAYMVDAGPGLNTKATKKQKATYIRVGFASDESNEKTFIIFSPFEGLPAGQAA